MGFTFDNALPTKYCTGLDYATKAGNSGLQNTCLWPRSTAMLAGTARAAHAPPRTTYGSPGEPRSPARQGSRDPRAVRAPRREGGIRVPWHRPARPRAGTFAGIARPRTTSAGCVTVQAHAGTYGPRAPRALRAPRVLAARWQPGTAPPPTVRAPSSERSAP